MRRRLVIVGVFLALGAVVNVAVACVLGARLNVYIDDSARALNPTELEEIWNLHGTGPEYRRTLNGWRGANWIQTSTWVGNEYFVGSKGEYGGFSTGGMATFIEIRETGFPLRWLANAQTSTMFPWYWKPRTLYEQMQWLRNCEARPIAFAADTLFLAAVLLVIGLSPVWLRRAVRIRRGQCPACGYDLRGLPHGVCPECGAQSTAKGELTGGGASR